MKISVRRKKLSNGNFSLYLDYYFQGERHYEFLELRLINQKETDRETLQMAENIKAQRVLEWQRRQFGFKPPARQKGNFVNYFEDIVNEKPKDRSSWYCTLRKIKLFTNENTMFIEIDEEWLRRFQRFLLSEVSPITAWHYYSNVKYVLSRAVREKIIFENPAINVPGIKKPESKREYLTIEEINLLVNTHCTNKDIKESFLFCCFTGLRYSDVKALRWENIRSNVIEYKQKKTSTVEYLPLSKSAKNILDIKKNENGVNSDEFIFNLPSKPQVHTHIKKWVKKSKINKTISFHTSRHTFATLSLTSGIDLYTVSKLLGHKNINTTQVYAKIIDEKKKEAVDKLPVIEV